MTGKPKRSSRPFKVLSLVAAIVGAAIAREVGSAAMKAYRRQSAPPMVQAMLSALDRQHGTAVVESATRGMTAAQAESASMSWSAKGVARLEPEAAFRRAELLYLMYQRIDTTVCGQWAKGQITPSTMRSAVSTLTATELDDWADISAAATLAEIQESGSPTVANDSQIVELFSGIADELSDSDRMRYLGILQDFEMSSNSDACWLSRTTYERVARAPQPSGSRRALLIAAIDASAAR